MPTAISAPTSESLDLVEDVGGDSMDIVSPPAHQAGEDGAGSSAKSASNSKTWAFVAGALKKTLSGAVSLIPEPFKGPAEILLKIVDVFEVT